MWSSGDVAPGGFVTKIGDERRHDIQGARVRRDVVRRDDRWKLIFQKQGQAGVY